MNNTSMSYLFSSMQLYFYCSFPPVFWILIMWRPFVVTILVLQAEKLMRQIGVKNVKLSEYEMSIAAHLVDPLSMQVNKTRGSELRRTRQDNAASSLWGVCVCVCTRRSPGAISQAWTKSSQS